MDVVQRGLFDGAFAIPVIRKRLDINSVGQHGYIISVGLVIMKRGSMTKGISQAVTRHLGFLAAPRAA